MKIHEYQAKELFKKHVTKKVVGFIAGLTALPERRMGHGGRNYQRQLWHGSSKDCSNEKSGIYVCEDLGSFGEMCTEVF